jgi:CBS domain-containing protein
VTGVAAYLSSINLAVAIFNLLPGFPLDGGRLFRALVWKITGNLTRATRIASIGGRALGFFIVFLGFWQFLQGNLLGGLWLVLIGWFLNNAAEAGYLEQLLQMSLEGVRARQAMTPHPETVSPGLMLRELVDRYFLLQRYQSFPVVEGDRPLGLVTLNQVKDVPRDRWNDYTVREIMTPVEKGIVVRPEDKLSDVLEKMEELGEKRVLVADNGKLEGIITASDILDWMRRSRALEDLKRDR